LKSKKDRRIRGQTDKGDWISLKDIQKGFVWVEKIEPNMVEEMLHSTKIEKQIQEDKNLNKKIENVQGLSTGVYRMIQNANARKTEFISSQKTREILKGEVIKIVKIIEIKNDRRIRGQIDKGDWISLKDTLKGYVWVEKIEPNMVEEIQTNHRNESSLLPVQEPLDETAL